MNKIAKLTAFGEDRYEESDWQDSVPGGKADKKTPMDFDPEKLSEGLKIELEHTDDRKLALEIAMDHLTEDEDYYRKLKKIEKKASVRMPSPRALLGFADELTKVATLTDILDSVGRSMAAPVAKVTRVLFTPIPFTPRLSAPILSPGQLDQLESAIAESIRERGLIYTGLKGLGVDELLQKAEPILGKRGVPKAVEETFGDRKIWSIANRPIAAIADQAVNFLPFGGGWAAKAIGPISYLAEKARIINPPAVYPGDVPYYDLKRKTEKLLNPVLEDLGMKTLDLSKRAEDMQIGSMQPDYGHGRGLKKKRPVMRKRAQDDVQDSIAEMLAQAQSQIGTQQPFWGGNQNTFWADQGSTDQSNVSDTFYGHGRGLTRRQAKAIKKTASLLLGRRY